MRFEARDGMGGPADYQLGGTGVGEPVVAVDPLVLRTTRAGIDLVAGVAQGTVDGMNTHRVTAQTDKPGTTNPR